MTLVCASFSGMNIGERVEDSTLNSMGLPSTLAGMTKQDMHGMEHLQAGLRACICPTSGCLLQILVQLRHHCQLSAFKQEMLMTVTECNQAAAACCALSC